MLNFNLQLILESNRDTLGGLKVVERKREEAVRESRKESF